MYSRSINSGGANSGELRVPKNYSGNAFSFEPPKYEPPVARESDIIPRNKTIPEDECEKIEDPPREVCKTEEKPIPEVCKKEEKSTPALFGFSTEDLLLIALILILSANEAEDDLLLSLALILAYKR